MIYKIFICFFLIYSIHFKVFSLDPPKELILIDLKKGNGIKAEKGSLVFVHYRGWLFDSKKNVKDPCKAKGKMFDSTLDDGYRNNPGTKESLFSFRLGKRLVIEGWERGIENMTVGGKRCLVIPPHLAYGNRDIGRIIKANSYLIFEVDLVSVE